MRSIRLSPSGIEIPLSTLPVAARLSATGTQSVTIGTPTPLEFDTIDFDRDEFIPEGSTAPFDRFTAPEDGFYQIGGFWNTTLGVDEEATFVMINTTTGTGCGRTQRATATSGVSSDFGACTVDASAGDEIQFVLSLENVAPGSRIVNALRNFWIIQISP